MTWQRFWSWPLSARDEAGGQSLLREFHPPGGDVVRAIVQSETLPLSSPLTGLSPASWFEGSPCLPLLPLPFPRGSSPPFGAEQSHAKPSDLQFSTALPSLQNSQGDSSSPCVHDPVISALLLDNKK